MASYGRAPTRQDTDVIGKRVGAQLVDLFAVGVLSFVILLFMGFLGAAAGGSESAVAALMNSLGYLVITGLLIGYSFILETVWNGQTIGKRLFGIRVVKENGDELDAAGSLIRNLPGLASLGLIAYLVALLSMASSDMRQRLFDRLAGTVVVTEHPQNNPQPQQNQQPAQQQQRPPQ
ncbi:RDD family protein [Candidatus Nanohalovita haloferacivicina]|uniref:RDD family protein n=1 Tax=Candidatus Nanohalovita haloferacivicina TaxID=2978046 RepID=UPI00325F9BF8|nr:RDD family protein [Candidatus Nanohalobia archaeon BNXNv]